MLHCWKLNVCLVCVVFPPLVLSSVFPKGGSCELKGKQDKQDFQLLLRCFKTIGLQADQISAVWAILSSILQLGNMCFSSYEVRVTSGGENRKIWKVSRPHGLFFPFRASRLRWLVSSVRLRPGGLDACCRFPQRPCRQSSLIELRSDIILFMCHSLAIIWLYDLIN